MRSCRVCGCTDDDCSGCVEATGAPCWWVEPDLCSRCDGSGPFSGDVEGEPDTATVGALLRGEARPMATLADKREAALIMLEGTSARAVAAALGEHVGQIRVWARWARGDQR